MRNKGDCRVVAVKQIWELFIPSAEWTEQKLPQYHGGLCFWTQETELKYIPNIKAKKILSK